MGKMPSFIPLMDRMSNESNIRFNICCRLLFKFATGRRRCASHGLDGAHAGGCTVKDALFQGVSGPPKGLRGFQC